MPALRNPIKREICPPSHVRWVEAQEDKFSHLEALVRSWLQHVSDTETLFKRHVYDVEKISQFDLRQHRGALYDLLFNGEKIAMDLCTFVQNPSAKSYLQILDEKLTQLLKTLLEWHTPRDYVDEVPESFKQGMKEAAEGKLMEFPGGEA